MADPMWPGPKSKSFRRIVEQARTFYDKEYTHEEYVELNEKIRTSTEGSNYHEVLTFFSPEHRSFFAIWQTDGWIACKRGQSHVVDLLPPSVLDEFREAKLHYREPHIRPHLRTCKAHCIERFQWDGFTLREWMEFGERIRRSHEQPGVFKVEDRGEHEVWAVNKKGLYWFACVWDPKDKVVVGIEKVDELYRKGILADVDN